MHPLVKETRRRIETEKLICRGETVIAAVSGGPDSSCMVEVLARLSRPLGFSLVAAYLNHGLRPTEAAGEELLVAQQAKALAIPCRIERADVPTHARQQKLSTEHAARELRYRFLTTLANELGAQKIALAHTADDQAEEILLRLLRGSGRKGLSGMLFLRAHLFIRPFLQVPKQMLLEYAGQYSIPFLEDSSNREPHCLRNRIRLELLPMLEKEFNPNIKQVLRQTGEILQAEEQLLENEARLTASRLLQAAPANDSPAADHPVPPPQTIDLEDFSSLHLAMQRRILEIACWTMDYRPQFRTIEQIRDLAAPGSGSRLHFKNGFRVTKKSGRLLFSYPAGRTHTRGDLDDPVTEAGDSQPLIE